MHKKIVPLLMAAGAAGSLMLFGASGAGAAATLPHAAKPMTVVTGPGSTDGTSGYFSTKLGQKYTRIEAKFDLTPAMENIGITSSLTSPQGAVGAGVCDNASGKAAEEGVTYNGKDVAGVATFSVDAALGALPANGGDPCVGNGILNNGSVLHPLLQFVPVGDSVTVLIQQTRNGVEFSAENDNTTQSFSKFIATRTCRRVRVGRRHHRHWRTRCTGSRPYYNEALAGVMQNLTNLGGAASNDLVDFSGVNTNEGTLGVNDAAESVTSSGTGNAPWLVGPAENITTGPNGEACPNLNGALSPLGGGDFSICVATPTGA